MALLALLLGHYSAAPEFPAHWSAHPIMRVAHAVETRVAVHNGIALEVSRRDNLVIYLIDIFAAELHQEPLPDENADTST